jgi:flagellar motor component MotA
MHATAPVSVRPAPRMPRRGPLTVMGPWAPVAGGLLGLVLGVVAVLLLAGSADTFEDRLALAFVVLGLGMLGTSGILLGDEVAMQRQRARDVAVRPAWVEATAGLLNGLTPARLLLAVSAFVLFLAAFVSRG